MSMTMERLFNPNEVRRTSEIPTDARVLKRSNDVFFTSASNDSTQGLQTELFDRVSPDEHTRVLTPQDVRQEIEQYEARFGISSAELLDSVRQGTAPDDFEIGLWKALLKYSR